MIGWSFSMSYGRSDEFLSFFFLDSRRFPMIFELFTKIPKWIMLIFEHLRWIPNSKFFERFSLIFWRFLLTFKYFSEGVFNEFSCFLMISYWFQGNFIEFWSFPKFWKNFRKFTTSGKYTAKILVAKSQKFQKKFKVLTKIEKFKFFFFRNSNVVCPSINEDFLKNFEAFRYSFFNRNKWRVANSYILKEIHIHI